MFMRGEGEKELDMEREICTSGRGDCMCKGPEVGKDLVCSRLDIEKAG